MRILALITQVPFVRGGAEFHAEGLIRSLIAAGHQAEIVTIPFKWYPADRILDHMLACRLIDLSEACGDRIDRVIGLKFPAYLMPHPNKVMWVLHQHRSAYDLWQSPLDDLSLFPDGTQVRQSIIQADNQAFAESRANFTNSGNVSRRLKQFNGIDASPLYHPPPGAEQFHSATSADYFFFPSRLNVMKRQALVLEALALTQYPVKVKFAGRSDDRAMQQTIEERIQALNLGDRVTFLDAISEADKIYHYAHCLGVIYPPLDEDYGYVTLEAMLAAKPVITCADSGGPLEFVLDHVTGLIAQPQPAALAAALDQIWDDRHQATQWGKAGRDRYDSMNISWNNVVEQLLTV
jgi:glycosyltransferase involved in cell wall biosynthesis